MLDWLSWALPATCIPPLSQRFDDSEVCFHGRGKREIIALFLVCIPRPVSRSTDALTALDMDRAEISVVQSITVLLGIRGTTPPWVLAVTSDFVTDVHISHQKVHGSKAAIYFLQFGVGPEA